MTGIMSSAIRVNVFKGWIQEQSGVGVGWQGKDFKGIILEVKWVQTLWNL